MISISLSCCYEKVFSHMNKLMIVKNSMKCHYLRKKNFTVNLNIEEIIDPDYTHARKVCKDFEIKHLDEYYKFYVPCNTYIVAS